MSEETGSCAELFPRLLPALFEQVAGVVHGEGQEVENDEQAGQSFLTVAGYATRRRTVW